MSERLTQTVEWVACSERMPERTDRYVLVAFGTHGRWPARWTGERWEPMSHGPGSFGPVTHWLTEIKHPRTLSDERAEG